MTREREDNFGGGALGNRDATSDQVEGIRAQASGYGNLTYLKTGRYLDLTDDGSDITNPQSTIEYTNVPPGNSYNPDHYATDDGPGASRSEATSEVVAAAIRLDGEMREAVTVDFQWTRPDGDVAWSGSASIDDPSTADCGGNPCEWWGYVYFYTFLGRDFSQDGQPEITTPGNYTVEFDTNYGTYTADVEMVGATANTCSLPNEVPAGGSESGVVNVVNSTGGSVSGDVVVAEDMTSSKTDRESLVISRTPFSMTGTQLDKNVSVTIPASGIGDAGTTVDDIVAYVVTD
jgi:hypothetical protein